jgi:threonine synthase
MANKATTNKAMAGKSLAGNAGWKGTIDAYRELLSVSEDTRIVTLYEGNTPLIPVPRLAAALGIRADLRVKYEGLNPTGSFKDRGMTMAVTMAVNDGAKAIMCASTGNTSASAAAFAARAGIEAIVLLPAGKVALGKLSQALQHGAKVIAVDGNFDDCLELVKALTQRHPITLVNSLNPHRIEGQTTAAYEVCDALGDAPTHLCIPVGNAGNITAYHRGFRRYMQAGKSTHVPKMMGFQAAGSAPIVHGHVIENPETIATAIRIGNPASWKLAEAARDDSGGVIEAVTDAEILTAWHQLAKTEGIFCEPASAASVAGVAKLAQRGALTAADQVVCVLTGHGLKDPDRAVVEAGEVPQAAADIGAVERLLGLCGGLR